jgi:hypothetical protein
VPSDIPKPFPTPDSSEAGPGPEQHHSTHEALQERSCTNETSLPQQTINEQCVGVPSAHDPARRPIDEQDIETRTHSETGPAPATDLSTYLTLEEKLYTEALPPDASERDEDKHPVTLHPMPYTGSPPANQPANESILDSNDERPSGSHNNEPRSNKTPAAGSRLDEFRDKLSPALREKVADLPKPVMTSYPELYGSTTRPPRHPMRMDEKHTVSNTDPAARSKDHSVVIRHARPTKPEQHDTEQQPEPLRPHYSLLDSEVATELQEITSHSDAADAVIVEHLRRVAQEYSPNDRASESADKPEGEEPDSPGSDKVRQEQDADSTPVTQNDSSGKEAGGEGTGTAINSDGKDEEGRKEDSEVTQRPDVDPAAELATLRQISAINVAGEWIMPIIDWQDAVRAITGIVKKHDYVARGFPQEWQYFGEGIGRVPKVPQKDIQRLHDVAVSVGQPSSPDTYNIVPANFAPRLTFDQRRQVAQAYPGYTIGLSPIIEVRSWPYETQIGIPIVRATETVETKGFLGFGTRLRYQDVEYEEPERSYFDLGHFVNPEYYYDAMRPVSPEALRTTYATGTPIDNRLLPHPPLNLALQ